VQGLAFVLGQIVPASSMTRSSSVPSGSPIHWDVVRAAVARTSIDKLARHDLRRTCARLCHLAGGELDQIQFLLGHVSIQTTERYSDASRGSGSP